MTGTLVGFIFKSVKFRDAFLQTNLRIKCELKYNQDNEVFYTAGNINNV